MDEDTGGFDVQRFGDILTDREEALATLTALAGLGLVSVLDARHMVRPGLTTGACAGWAKMGCGQLGQLRPLRRHGSLVDLGGFVEPIRLAAGQLSP